MRAAARVSVIINTFERPFNLRRTLASIAVQRGIDGCFELIVSDDGSRDETAEIVERFTHSVRDRFRVQFVTHPHDGFRVARVRNRGAEFATGDLLVFLDGDCVVEPDHIVRHRSHHCAGTAVFGFPCVLNRQLSERVDEACVASARVRRMTPARERVRIMARTAKARLYAAMRHPSLPRFRSTNFALSRTDFDRVGGFDERFVGWGDEDTDFGIRLRRGGVRIDCSSHYAPFYHLWHPRVPDGRAERAELAMGQAASLGMAHAAT